MSIKYLSSSGLTEVWSNIKAYIASKIPSKIITGLSINGKTITYTNSDGTTGTLTTQDTNTDTKVTQTITTTNAEYPVLFSTDANKTATSTTTARFSSNIKINPNTNTITATTFKGNLSGTATKATQDASGNVITNTYATKSELNTKADDANVVHKSGTETIVGTKTFSDVTCFNKELVYKDNKYDWTNTSLDTWCDAGHVAWLDKTGNRRMHELVGTKGGVWRKACYINEKQYFNVDSDGYIAYWGYITFNGGAWFNGDSFLKMTNLESNTTTPTSVQYKTINVIANNGSQIGKIQFAKRADGSFDTTIFSHGGSGNINNGALRIASNNEVYPLNNKTKLGTTSVKWSEVWANTFNGNLVSSQINVSNNSSLLRIFGGTSASTGANLDLYGENESKSGGDFVLRARKSSGYKALIGKINGTLTWDGKTVLTAGNGVTLDTAQTITGAKTFAPWTTFLNGINVKWITGNKEQKSLHLFGSMNDAYVGSGSVLELHADDANYGMFTLIARDKTNTNLKRFVGLPDGTLMWDNNEILTRVNGVTLDTAQTITGEKTFRRTVHVESITGKGPSNNLWVYAGDLNASYSKVNMRIDGTIALDCVNATTKKSSQMNLKPDGTLTWAGKTVLTAGNGVTVDTAQTISGNKTFTGQTTFIGHNLLVKNPTVDLLHSTDSSWVGAGITGTDKNNVRIGFIDFFIGTNDCTFKVFCRNRQDVEKEVFYAGINTNGAYGVVDGKHIVRTVNGIGANQEGNVNLTNTLGFTPVQQGGGTGQLNTKIYIGWTGSQLKCTVDKKDLGAFVFEGRAQVGTTITAYWGSSSSTGNKWERIGGLNGTMLVSSTSSTFTPVVGQIYSGNQLYSTAMPNGGVGATDEPYHAPGVVYACLNLSGAFNSSYKYLCTTAVGVNATASVYVTGHTKDTSAGPYTTITGYSGFTETVQGGKSTFLRVQ